MPIGRALLLLALLPVALAQTHKPISRPASTSAKVRTTAVAPHHPNVILITIDTTRADRMGFLGSDRGLTPNLDALAKQATVFTRAYSHVPITTASHASILTGTYPQYNHVTDFGAALAPGLPFLPDILHQGGYSTGAFVGSLILDPRGGMAPGFDRGFDVYEAGYRAPRRGETRYGVVERRAGDVVAHALDWLKQRPKTRPFFLWVHVFDPHDPYDPPEPYKSKFRDPYDGEIAYADASLGKLFAYLHTAGLFSGSTIAVMADHGEAFGEHGERTHGIFLYDETIHVPLLIKLPAAASAKTTPKVDTRVGLVDVMPTILESAGFPISKSLQGQSLVPWILPAKSAAPPADRPAYAETDYPHRAFKWSSLRALRTGKYLYIEAPKRELYDQVADPKATQNLASTSPAIADTLNSQAETFRKSTMVDVEAASKLSPEQAAKLAALGYVGGDSRAGPEGVIGGVDPKDRIETANLLHDGMMEVEQGQYQDAIAKLEQVVKAEPDSAIGHAQLGTAWTRLKNYDKALPVLLQAIQLNPDNGLVQYELGLALFETGDLKGSAEHFAVAVDRTPQWADAHYSLASVYARIDRMDNAVAELKKAIELNPDHYRAHLLLGRLLSIQEKYQEAIPSLQRALELQPDSRDAHNFLADVYERTGEPAKAAEERARAGQGH